MIIKEKPTIKSFSPNSSFRREREREGECLVQSGAQDWATLAPTYKPPRIWALPGHPHNLAITQCVHQKHQFSHHGRILNEEVFYCGDDL